MSRFDPEFVWRCFNPDILVKLIDVEATRLQVPVDPWRMDEFDFYQEMVRGLSKKVGDAVPIAWKDSGIEDYYNAVYLSCLLLFGKPGYLDIPVAEYFAQEKVAKWMSAVDYRKLTDTELDELSSLRKDYGKINSLTNPELNFVVSLYERGKV
jgi:hypothetical protein